MRMSEVGEIVWVGWAAEVVVSFFFAMFFSLHLCREATASLSREGRGHEPRKGEKRSEGERRRGTGRGVEPEQRVPAGAQRRAACKTWRARAGRSATPRHRSLTGNTTQRSARVDPSKVGEAEVVFEYADPPEGYPEGCERMADGTIHCVCEEDWGLY